jgi:Family of unknown function (DUF6174)
MLIAMKRRSLLASLGGVALLFVTSACMPSPTKPENTQLMTLRENRAKWQRALTDGSPTRHYKMTVSPSAMLPADWLVPMVFEHQNGTLLEMRTTKGGMPAAGAWVDFTRTHDEMDKLFAMLETAIQTGAERVEVIYDPTLGYPSQFTIDPKIQAADDELYYTISDVVILK